VPVIVVICDPKSELCYWQVVDFQKLTLHKKGWTLNVPSKNQFVAECADDLRRISERLQKKDLLELALRDWIGWSFHHRMRLVSEFALPEDYMYLWTLGNVNDKYVMFDYVLSNERIGFEQEKVARLCEAATLNHRMFQFRRFLLAFVSESQQLLATIPQPEPIDGIVVEFVPLLFDIETLSLRTCLQTRFLFTRRRDIRAIMLI